jgi:hypothetical protein
MPTDDVLTWIPHLKIQIGGTIGIPQVEIWSNSVRFRIAGGAPTPAQLQAIAAACGPSVSSWIARGSSAISKAVIGTYVKAVWVQANGKQRDANTAQFDLPAATSTGTNANDTDWATTYCATFRTAVKRGRAHSGRIYPPVAGNGPQGTLPYCADGDAAAMANSAAVLLTNLDGQIATVLGVAEAGTAPAVFSPGSALRGTAPLSNDIIAVVVDQVADIMHSRTNRIPRKESAPQAVG